MDEGLEGGVARLEIVNVFFVDAFATMVRVGVVNTFGSIDGRTGRTAWGIAVTLMIEVNDRSAREGGVGRRGIAEEQARTLDFLLRQALHAVLTHRLLAEAEADESFLSSFLLWDLDLVGLGVDDRVVVGWSESSSILGVPAIFLGCAT